MNLSEHWSSGIPRSIGQVKAAGLRESEFIGGEVDLRINIYRGQINANGVKDGIDGVENGNELATIDDLGQNQKLLKIVAEDPTATRAQYAEQPGISKRTVSKILQICREEACWNTREQEEKQNGLLLRKDRYVYVEFVI